ncbi:site-specific integrase [Nonomuraea sp. NPDC049750]|uniref:site-specific integrase n=1 Tax=Nonomuraea sp. NPDC049750 TaxID=3154738 RepID=UPI0033FB91AD
MTLFKVFAQVLRAPNALESGFASLFRGCRPESADLEERRIADHTAERQHTVWTVDEARRFLEHLRAIDDPLYAAYVFILVLGLRRGEVLGLAWDCVELGGEQLWISRQLTRVGGWLLHRETTKTEDSTASLPLFGLCVSALRHRQRVQEEARKAAGDKWKPSDLTFTTRTGTPIEPRNFNRAFENHCRHAGVPRIRVHDTRHTWASLLAALDIHPRVAMRIPPAFADLDDHGRLHPDPKPRDPQGTRPAE